MNIRYDSTLTVEQLLAQLAALDRCLLREVHACRLAVERLSLRLDAVEQRDRPHRRAPGRRPGGGPRRRLERLR
jgi:hypothetical protein